MKVYWKSYFSGVWERGFHFPGHFIKGTGKPPKMKVSGVVCEGGVSSESESESLRCMSLGREGCPVSSSWKEASYPPQVLSPLGESLSVAPTTNINHTPCQIFCIDSFTWLVLGLLGKPPIQLLHPTEQSANNTMIKDQTKRSLSSFFPLLASLLGKDIKLAMYSCIRPWGFGELTQEQKRAIELLVSF